jgi:HPt (histidine-containing phosphotransfer) domain-containing protein
MKETLKLCNNNETLAHELIAMLKNDLPRQKIILVDAYQRQDMRLLRDIVHQILGSCSYISLPQIEKAAQVFQFAVHSNEPGLETLKTNLIKAMDAVIMMHS